MKITIDPSSGFCFGVDRAIAMAEEMLKEGREIYCLGEIVHNQEEMLRLKSLGLKVIGRPDFPSLPGAAVLIRAHGEPPETYAEAKKFNITLMDATCPIVARIQQRIKKSFLPETDKQIVIYGKQGHAEVAGLAGQTGNRAIVVKDISDLEQIDFSKPVEIFSQTTMSVAGFRDLVAEISARMKSSGNSNIEVHDTICRKVSRRESVLRKFAAENDLILFVGGKNSSNGAYLFGICKEVNPLSYYISDSQEIKFEWLQEKAKVGLAGATSTPRRQLEEVADFIRHSFPD